jgi:hypothetical protein
VRYEVEIDWLGRRLAQLPRRTAGRIGWTRTGRERRRARRERDGKQRSGWLDVLDLGTFSGGDGAGAGALLLAAVLLLALGVLWQLGVLAVVLALLELAVLLPLLLVVFVVRVLLRRPWRVVVRTSVGETRVAADVRGYRAARHLRERWTEELAAGWPVDSLAVPASVPGTLRTDLLDLEGFGEVRPDEIAG